MTALILKPKKEEWDAKRPYQIGASEIATIVGCSKYGDIIKLWNEKVSKNATPIENDAMLWGHCFEDGVAKLFEAKTGYEVISSSTGDWQFVREGAEWMSCSPDRTYWLDKDKNGKRNARDWSQKGLLECKTTVIDPEAEGNEWLLQSWYCQVQWQLLVSELTEAHLCCAVFGYERKTVIRHWQADKQFQEKLLAIVTKFWEYNVGQNIAPEPTDKKEVEELFPKETEGSELIANDELNELVSALKMVKANKKLIEEKEKELTDKLAVAMLDSEKLTYGGNVIATYKKNKDGVKFDKERFANDNYELYEQYCSPSKGARVLKLK